MPGRTRKRPVKARVAEFSTIADAVEELQLNDNEASDVEVENELFELVSDNIDAAEESGLIDEDEADDLRADLVDEHRQRLEIIYGLDGGDNDDDDDDEDDEDISEDDTEDYYDDSGYASGTSLATFRSASPFADALLTIGDAAGYEEVEDLVADLADYLGIDDEAAVGLVTGELVPDEDVLDVIADGFGLDDDTYEVMAGLAEEEREGVYDDDDDDDEEEVRYSRYQDARVGQLENQIAEFQAQQVVSDQLAIVEREIDECVDNAWMPPVAKQILLGNFERETDRIAAFSQVCARNGVDPDTELYSLQRVVATFRRCFEGNPIASFGSEILDPLTPREEEELDEVWQQAEANHRLRRKTTA